MEGTSRNDLVQNSCSILGQPDQVAPVEFRKSARLFYNVSGQLFSMSGTGEERQGERGRWEARRGRGEEKQGKVRRGEAGRGEARRGELTLFWPISHNWCLNDSSQFYITYNLADGVLCPIILSHYSLTGPRLYYIPLSIDFHLGFMPTNTTL